MLDQENSEMDWRHIYGLLNSYERYFVLYSEIRRRNSDGLVHLANTEITFILISIDKTWLSVDMPPQLKLLINKFVKNIKEHLVEFGNIHTGINNNDDENCISICDRIHTALV